MTCDKCQNQEPTTNMILLGKFGSYCHQCIRGQQRSASAQSAQWHRDRDREDHQRDILQPWVKDKPNTEFIRQYPDKAKEMYTEEELKEYG